MILTLFFLEQQAFLIAHDQRHFSWGPMYYVVLP